MSEITQPGGTMSKRAMIRVVSLNQPSPEALARGAGLLLDMAARKLAEEQGAGGAEGREGGSGVT